MIAVYKNTWNGSDIALSQQGKKMKWRRPEGAFVHRNTLLLSSWPSAIMRVTLNGRGRGHICTEYVSMNQWWTTGLLIKQLYNIQIIVEVNNMHDWLHPLTHCPCHYISVSVSNQWIRMGKSEICMVILITKHLCKIGLKTLTQILFQNFIKIISTETENICGSIYMIIW